MVGYTADEFLAYVMPVVKEQGLLVDGKDYYESIAHYCHVNNRALRTWLENRVLGDKFLRMNRAPSSEAKLKMIATESATNHSDEDKLKDLIRSGGVGVSPLVVSVPHLKVLAE
jgi:hypothetical protein